MARTRALLAAALLLGVLPRGASEAEDAPAARPPAFEEAAAAWGLPAFAAGRSVAVDLDGDGWPDLVCNSGERVFRNEATPDGKGRRFVDVTDAAGLAPKEGRGASILAWGDVDGDGDVDCFYGRYSDFAAEAKKKNDDGLRSEIRLNDGKGRFTTKAGSGVGEHAETTSAATFFDADGDGVLDLYVGNWYVRYGEGLECFPSRLFRGKGGGTFEDVTEKAGMLGALEPGMRASRRPVYGVTHTDWDDDGDQDLLVCAYGRQWNVLWRNDGGLKFTDVGETTGFDGDADRSGVYPAKARENPRLKDLEDEKPFRSNGNTFDAAVADFDADGDVDVFLAEITHWWAGPSSDLSALLVSGGRAAGFAFAREARGIVRSHPTERWNQGDLYAGWLDVGNDGLLDLFVASGDYPDEQRLRLFRQRPDRTFEDATASSGIDWTNCAQPTVADFDRDGVADVLLGNSNTRLSPEQTKDRVLRPALFRQRAGGRSLRLTLEGKGAGGANRSALGARVTVRAGDLRAVREVTGSRGHAGHHDEFALTFGLGPHAKIDELVVRWPDRAATVQRFTAVAADQRLHLRQGGILTPSP
jgi:enediyne biosynthesis protein E4